MTEMSRTFPLESHNRPPGSAWSLPYRMGIISPPTAFTETLEVDPKIVATQLHHGCLAANDMLVLEFRMDSIGQHRQFPAKALALRPNSGFRIPLQVVLRLF